MPAGPGPDPMLPRRYRVVRAWNELIGVASLEIAPIEGGDVPAAPGQFNMLYAFGIGEAAISISGDHAKPQFVHTIRAVGAVSQALTELVGGDVLGVRGPFGSSWPIVSETGRHILLIAGGLGLAPLRPALYHALRHRERYLDVTLIYGARSPDDLLYAGQLGAWSARSDVRVEVTVDHAPASWTGRVGVVTTGLDRLLSRIDPASLSAFVCGPEVMMRYAVMSLLGAGVAHDRVWISMERNMKCAIGFCGHCQFGPSFVCRDGPVFRHDAIADLLATREI